MPKPQLPAANTVEAAVFYGAICGLAAWGALIGAILLVL